MTTCQPGLKLRNNDPIPTGVDAGNAWGYIGVSWGVRPIWGNSGSGFGPLMGSGAGIYAPLPSGCP